MPRQALPSVGIAAANLAAWQEASLVPLGHHPRADQGVWRVALEDPGIWYSAITLTSLTPTGPSSRERIEELLAGCGGDPDAAGTVVCDSFRQLRPPPTRLHRAGESRWYGRRATGAAPLPPLAEGLTIRALSQPGELAELVATAARSFGLTPPLDPFTVHPPALLADRRCLLLGGFCDARLVGTAMAQVHGDSVGVYGVGVLPEHRGRGLGEALTRYALAWRPELPAVLQPTPSAARLYRRIGFVEIGRSVVLRPAAATTSWPS